MMRAVVVGACMMGACEGRKVDIVERPEPPTAKERACNVYASNTMMRRIELTELAEELAKEPLNQPSSSAWGLDKTLAAACLARVSTEEAQCLAKQSERFGSEPSSACVSLADYKALLEVEASHESNGASPPQRPTHRQACIRISEVMVRTVFRGASSELERLRVRAGPLVEQRCLEETNERTARCLARRWNDGALHGGEGCFATEQIAKRMFDVLGDVAELD